MQALALRYAEAYEGCYGEDEIDRYVGEVCADAYAGLERFGEASKQAADAVWQTRQAEKSAEKPASPRGPPEEYSIANTRKMPWKEQVQGYFKNDKTIKSSDSLYLGESNVSRVANSPLYVPTSVITKAIRPPKGSRSAHSLTQADILKLESGIKNAAAVIVNPERNAIAYLTGNRDSAGNYVIAAFDMNNDLFGENAHKATSIHGRENIAAMLEKLGGSATIFVKNEDKLNQMLPGNQILKSLELLAKVELDEQSIAEQRENVNPDFSIEAQAGTDNAPAEQETETRNLTMDTIPKKAQSYLNGAARNLAASLQRKTLLPFADHSAEIRDSIKPLMNEYLQAGDIRQETIDKSFDEAYAKGVELEKELYEKSKTLAQKLRQTPITLNEKERAALRSYDVFKKTTKGRLYVVNEGGRSVSAAHTMRCWHRTGSTAALSADVSRRSAGSCSPCGPEPKNSVHPFWMHAALLLIDAFCQQLVCDPIACEKLFGHIGLLFRRFAALKLLDDRAHARAMERVALGAEVELPVLAVLQRPPPRVEGNKRYAAGPAGSAHLVQRLHNAEAHIVIFAVDHVRHGIALQIGAGLLICLRLRKVAVQLRRDRPALVAGRARLQRGRTLELRRGAGRALQMQDLHVRVFAFAGFQCFCQPSDSLIGSLSEIRADPARIE